MTALPSTLPYPGAELGSALSNTDRYSCWGAVRATGRPKPPPALEAAPRDAAHLSMPPESPARPPRRSRSPDPATLGGRSARAAGSSPAGRASGTPAAQLQRSPPKEPGGGEGAQKPRERARPASLGTAAWSRGWGAAGGGGGAERSAASPQPFARLARCGAGGRRGAPIPPPPSPQGSAREAHPARHSPAPAPAPGGRPGAAGELSPPPPEEPRPARNPARGCLRKPLRSGSLGVARRVARGRARARAQQRRGARAASAPKFARAAGERGRGAGLGLLGLGRAGPPLHACAQGPRGEARLSCWRAGAGEGACAEGAGRACPRPRPAAPRRASARGRQPRGARASLQAPAVPTAPLSRRQSSCSLQELPAGAVPALCASLSLQPKSSQVWVQVAAPKGGRRRRRAGAMQGSPPTSPRALAYLARVLRAQIAGCCPEIAGGERPE